MKIRIKRLSLPKYKIVASMVLIAMMFIFLVPSGYASQEVIDSDTKSGSKMKVSAVLYKDTGEIDPNWDYYAVKVTIEDTWTKNDPWVGPMYADIYVYFPTQADEVPSNHEPKAGWYWSQFGWSFSFMCIGLSGLAPAYGIGYEAKHYSSYFRVHWWYYGWSGPVAYWFIFEDYTEAAVGVRVPQGFKPSINVSGRIVWYRFYIFWFSYETQQYVGGVNVDPPGATRLHTPMREAAPRYPKRLKVGTPPS